MENPPISRGAKILLANHAGECLFLHRSKPFAGEPDALWDIPGGRVKPGESLLDGALRELDEEGGLKPDKIDPWPIAVQHIRRIGLYVVRYTFQGWVEDRPPVALGPEHQDLTWATLEEGARLRTDPYLAEVIAVERSRQQ